MSHQLAGKRILIAEDNFLIALNLADAITDQEGQVIGPYASVERALAAIKDERVDGAILNVDLQDGESYPLADALDGRGIPFIFATGYDKIPERFATKMRVAKPSPANQVAHVLVATIARASNKLVAGARPRA